MYVFVVLLEEKSYIRAETASDFGEFFCGGGGELLLYMTDFFTLQWAE